MARKHCSRCHQIIPSCLCHLIIQVANPIPVFVVQDPRETRHALGTVKLAQQGLQNFTLLPVIPGEIEAGSKLLNSALPDNAAMLYPGSDAVNIASCASTCSSNVRPNTPETNYPDVSLVFIDATWRRSKRILLEHPVLQRLPRYQLTQVSPPRYRLRKAPASDALSTLEAIVEILVRLDTARCDDYRRLLAAMDQMVDQQIRAMGGATYLNNYC